MNAFLSRDHNNKQRQQAIRAYEKWADSTMAEQHDSPLMLGRALLAVFAIAAVVAALWGVGLL